MRGTPRGQMCPRGGSSPNGGLASHRRPTQGSSAQNSAGYLKELLEALGSGFRRWKTPGLVAL